MQQIGEMIKFNGEIHSLMGYDSSVAVTDHLIFNADPGVMDEYNSLSEEEKKSFDINKLGEGIEFHGYNDEEGNLDLSQAFTKTSFIFDGKDDYLELPYNNDTKFENGFCLEFYGKIRGGGTNWDFKENKDIGYLNDNYIGIFNITEKNIKENYDEEKFFRFGFRSSGDYLDSLMFNFGIFDAEWRKEVTKPGVDIGWSVLGSPWNQVVTFKEELNKDLYCIVVFDANENAEKLYINGSLVSSAKISHKYWEKTESVYEKNKNSYNGICFGVGSMNYPYNFYYANLECYSCRLYGRPLTDDEVSESYKKTLSYHDFLEKN